MDNPFPSAPSPQDSLASKRRSTRIDFITTVLLSGKDAGGTPFREFTQTSIVNLHGCKVRTSYRIMVGMIISLECPKAGTSGKGVCVRVWDASPGIAGHEIAIQLIKPQNLWGVPNPPPDWELVAKSMVQGRVASAADRTGRFPAAPPLGAAPPTDRTGRFGAPTLPGAPPAVERTGRFQAPGLPGAGAPPPARPSAVTATVAPMAPLPTPTPSLRAVPTAGATNEQRLGDLERRATQLVDSVLDIMRGQAEELTRGCLEEYRQQVDALIQDAEGRLRQTLQTAYEESAASLIGLRSDLMEQMASRGAQIIRSTEDSVRTRLRNQSVLEEKAPANPGEKFGEK